MHSGAPVAQKLNRPPAPFGREFLTYRVFAQWVIGRSTRQIRTTDTEIVAEMRRVHGEEVE